MLTQCTPAQDKDHTITPPPPSSIDAVGPSDSEAAPVTRGFIISLFESLKANLHSLKSDLSQDIWDIHQDLASVGNHVSALEDSEHEETK
ncbi:hypothetical protein NDU88_007236 [Pleurodeles waltl]|uniref:Uncharacterized protein n=1 Tax=Pleurodeles waltl TaxID=8319 RepID=A0AAV7LX46_PLEWA|nr:hypothetical protein NDU88_007236 [Pleurodeles waltl]